jgi:hypothetical protein
MHQDCVPYPRRALYLLLTVPMIGLYIAIAAYMWTFRIAFFVVYIASFVLVAILQSYVCVVWECPYVGRFAPCAGGFCLPSSQIARLFRNTQRSETTYNIVVTLAFLSLIAFVLTPVYPLYRLGLLYLLAYVGVAIVYALCFLAFVCPVCATRHVCPGGQAAAKLRGSIRRQDS